MIFNLRKLLLTLPMMFCLGLGLALAPYLVSPAEAQSRSKSKNAKKSSAKKPQASRSRSKRRSSRARSSRESTAATAAKSSSAGAGGRLVATYGEWSTYVANAPTKTCYAAAQPRKREPARLKRDPGYFLISTRPKQGIRNEVAIIAGFGTKSGSDPEVKIGSAKYELVANGPNLWIKNAAEEGALLQSMRKGSTMTVHIVSGRGNKTVDSYSLSGITQALARANKECR